MPTSIRITNGEWQPYLSAYLPNYGASSHVVQRAFELQGINVNWGFFPWKRSYVIAAAGREWDASAVWWATPNIAEEFILSEPVHATTFAFFYNKRKPLQWDNFNDLTGLTIGITAGYDYGEEFNIALEKRIFRTTTTTIESDEIALKMLALGRLDAFANDPIVAKQQIVDSLSPANQELLKMHPREFSPNNLHLIVSKKTEHAEYYITQFNSGLEKLRKSGELDKINQQLQEGYYNLGKNLDDS